jgi:hypothetical protein
VNKRTAGLLAALGTVGILAAGTTSAGAATTTAVAPVIVTVRADSGDSPTGFETFKMKLTDPAVIADARANMAGQTSAFPVGNLAKGTAENTGFTWHLVNVQFAEMTIELCDGTPTYVENHQSEFRTYCPWVSKVIAINNA